MCSPELLPVAILAGGLATRLRPITDNVPKAMVDVAGKPFIVRQLEYLRDQGVRQVVMCTGYLGEQIEATVGDGAALGLSVIYSPDGPKLLGTGGAIKRALALLPERFFILYGDSFLPCDFAAVQRTFEASGKPAVMTVLHNANRWDKSNVLFRDDVLVEYNKHTPRPEMEYIDYGLGAVTARLFDRYPPDTVFDLADLYNALSVEGRLAGHEVHERFYEIGTVNALNETSAYFARRDGGLETTKLEKQS